MTTPPVLAQVIERIETATQMTVDRLAAVRSKDYHLVKVVLLGPSGNGKTTLMLGLFGNLIAVFDAGELGLQPADPLLLPDLTIGQGLGMHGTSIPAGICHDLRQVIFWDLVGNSDPGQAGEDIVNAAVNRAVFSEAGSHIRAILVMDENLLYQAQPIDLQNLLNETAASFSDIHELCQCLSVVITKHQSTRKPADRLQRLVTAGHLERLSAAGQHLLDFITTNFAQRCFLMPVPTEEGPYQLDTEGLLRMIFQRSTPALDLRMVPFLTAESQLLALAWAEQLNLSTIEFLRTDATRQLIDYCHRQIDTHQGSITNLRTRLTAISRTLRSLAQVTDPKLFLTIIAHYLANTQPLMQVMEWMNFLQEIKQDDSSQSIACNLPGWSVALLPFCEQLEQLVQPPTVTRAPDALYITGPLVSSSEVQPLLAGHLNVRIHATNAMVFDANLLAPGCRLICLAPTWVIAAPNIRVDLSGIHGLGGTDGRIDHPGHPGHNGGHSGRFYGRFFVTPPINMTDFTVVANGGHGGAGGRGGHGSVGADGRDGRLDHVSSRESYFRQRTGSGGGANNDVASWLGWHVAQHEIEIRGTCLRYHERGTDGTVGNNGRRGGAGGHGGAGGTIMIEGPQVQHIQRGAPGQPGQPGGSGMAGHGGRHGRHCRGSYLTDVWVNYEIWHHTGPFGWGREIEKRNDRVADRWEVHRHHQAPRGRAADGGVESGLVAAPPCQPEPSDIEPSVETQLFLAFYRAQQSLSPLVSLIRGIDG
jgi:hypothetical protein